MPLKHCLKTHKVDRRTGSKLQAAAANELRSNPYLNRKDAETAVVQRHLADLLAEQQDVLQQIKAQLPQPAADKPETTTAQPLETTQVAAAPGKIADFGEKIGGARKDFAAKFADAKKLDVATEPFAKTWPEPDYNKMLQQGYLAADVALVRAIRDEVPDKPRKSWKLSSWVELVKSLRHHAEQLLQGDGDYVRTYLAKQQVDNRAADHIIGRRDLYLEVGHNVSLRGITFERNYWNLYHGRENVWLWHISKGREKNAFSNMPRILGEGDTREQAIASFKQNIDKLEPKSKKPTQFIIYSKRGEPGVYIGKKFGRDYVDMQKFTDAKEARLYLKEHQADLEAQLAKMKDLPTGRNVSNGVRVGTDYRADKPATPELFQQAFGFRGVEFGNYVNAAQRQTALNEAYDALHDLAGLLNIPPRAISLNGELGLAFGARGTGGKDAPSAHYEPDKVVINLTKNKGAGSLAHEWFHALDHYLARNSGAYKDNITNNVVERGAVNKTRPEVIAAFKELAAALDATNLKARSRELDQTKSKDYWSMGIEMHARAFENYVIDKLAEQQGENDYLANINSVDQYAEALLQGFMEGKTVEDLYPYLLDHEKAAVVKAFDQLFAVMKTRETDRGIELYSNPMFNPTLIVKELGGLANNIKAAVPVLVRLGQRIIYDGAATYAQFVRKMRQHLGDLLPAFKGRMLEVYRKAKAAYKASLLGDEKGLVGVDISQENGDNADKNIKGDAYANGQLEAAILDRSRKEDGGSSLQAAAGELRRVLGPEFYRAANARRAKAHESKVLRAWATAAGLIKDRNEFESKWLAKRDESGQLIKGHEHDVIFNADGKTVTKRNRMPDSFHHSYQELFDRVTLFNWLFGKHTALTLTGFMDVDGTLMPVFEQNFIRGDRAGIMQTEKFLTESGFEPVDNKYTAYRLPGTDIILHDVFGENTRVSEGVTFPMDYVIMHGERAQEWLREAQSIRFARENAAESVAIPAEKFDAVLERVTAGLKDARRDDLFSPVATFADLPAAVQLEARKQGDDGKGIVGVFHKGKVYLVRDAMTSEALLEETIFHEWHGHYGLKQLFGKDMVAAMEQLHQTIGAGRIFTIGKKYGINMMQYGHALAKAGYDVSTRRAIMLEETLAFLTKEYSRGSIATKIREVTGQVRAWLRERGFATLANQGETDIAWLLKRARMYAEAGAGNTNAETAVFSANDLLQRLQSAGISAQQLDELLAFQPKFAAAWHGTPHDFDRFSTNHIGTGEGNQAYGYGLYFASSQGVAEHYKEMLSKNNRSFDPELVDARAGLRDTLAEVDNLGFDTFGEALQTIRKHRQDWFDMYEVTAEEASTIDKFLTTYEKRLQALQGKLYQVELAPAEDEYLLWDKPLSKQSPEVGGELEERWLDTYQEFASEDVSNDPTGHEVYKTISRRLGSDKAASDYLHSLGIRGIKYLDGTSRNAGEGNYNYVIFNDDDVSITAKFMRVKPDQLSETGALRKLKDLLNPFDYSRFRRFAEKNLPPAVKLGLQQHLSTPLWTKETTPESAKFYDEGADREVKRFEFNIRMFGGLVDKSKETLKGWDKLRAKLQWTDQETAWGKIRREGYKPLTDQERAAYDAIRFEGDAFSKTYKTLADALRNPRIKAAGMNAKVFEFYRQALEHEKDSFETKLKIVEENMAEAGIDPEKIKGHIAEWRAEYKRIAGWVHRDHGQGDYVVTARRIIDRLDFSSDEVQHEGETVDRVRLSYYPGVSIVNNIKHISEELGGSFLQTESGALVMLFKKGDGAKALERFKTISLDNNGKPFTVLTYNQFVATEAAAEKLAEKVRKDLKAAMPRNWREGHNFEVKAQFSDKVREWEFQAMQTSDMEMERVLTAALQKAKSKGELEQEDFTEIHDALIQNTAETLLGRGAGLHQIRRAEYLIEGYDTTDAVGKYEASVNGIAGMLSKARYALHQYKHLQKVSPQMRQWAMTYVADSLRNMGVSDRLSGNLRAIASLYYLGFNLSWMLVNGTQPLTLGQAELSRHTKGATRRLLSAEKDLLLGKITDHEQSLFLDEEVLNQERESFMAELAGANEGFTGRASHLLHSVTGASMLIGQKVEVLNRRATILAAYRTFTEQGQGHHEALKNALHVNSMVNIDMGKHNLPRFARTNAYGRTLYTLQSYGQHVLNFLYHRSTSGNRADQKAVLRFLFAMALLGGLPAGVPGSDELDKIMQKIWGYSPKLALRGWLKGAARDFGSFGEALEGFVWHGIPGAAAPLGVGVSLTGAVQLRMPVVSNVIAGDDLTKTFTGAVGGLGVKAVTGIGQLAKGDIARGVESLSPTALANILSGIRQSTTGVKTSHGKPAFYKGKPLVMTPVEGTIKALGMQPVRTADVNESRGMERALSSDWNERRKEALDAFRFGGGMAQVREFNDGLQSSQAAGLVLPITAKSLQAAKANKRSTAWQQRYGMD